MFLKKSKKLNKKILARLRTKRVQMILLAITTHKKNTQLIKVTASHVNKFGNNKGFKKSVKGLKKLRLPSRKKAKDKWG